MAPSLVATVLTPLSTVVLRQGEVAAAERYAMEAVEIAAGTGWEAAALVISGEALAARGDLEAAATATRRGLGGALDRGLENWFRMAVRDLAVLAAARGAKEDAALLLGASRRSLPSYGLDPAIHGPVEERCRAGLGAHRFDALTAQGAGLAHDDLVDLVGTGPGESPPAATPSHGGAGANP